MARAYVGVGSNLADPRAQVERAIDRLAAVGTVHRRSSLYRTQPWGNLDQPAFVNAVVELETTLAPHQLLSSLKELERESGRDPSAQRWGPRVIDLDILIYDDVELCEPHLTIPHPRLYERAFVLVPLAELDDRFAEARDALSLQELGGVQPV